MPEVRLSDWELSRIPAQVFLYREHRSSLLRPARSTIMVALTDRALRLRTQKTSALEKDHEAFEQNRAHHRRHFGHRTGGGEAVPEGRCRRGHRRTGPRSAAGGGK